MPRSERSLNKTERLFALVLLLQSRPSLTSRDLADHFGVSRRTIFRDLRALSESGVPLTYGDEGGYEILEGYHLPPLMLSAREAATVLIGAAFTRVQHDTSLRSDADAVTDKIRSVLPGPIRDYIDRLLERTVIAPYLPHADGEGLDLDGRWFDLSEAVAQQRSVFMTYYVLSRDEETKRKADPLALVYFSEAWNVVAFDHLRREVRNFRLDRIRKLRVLTDTFQPPADFDLEAYLRERGASPDATSVRLRFTERGFSRAQLMFPAQIVERRTKEDEVEVTFMFDNLEYLAEWLLRFGTDVRVVEPSELADRITQRAERLARHHGA